MNNKKLNISSLIVFSTIIIILALPLIAKSESKNNLEKIILEDDGILITANDINLMLKDMTFHQRRQISNNPSYLKSLLFDKLSVIKMSNAAKQKKLDKKPASIWKLENEYQNTLSKLLIKDYQENLIYPKHIETLAKEYYDSNQHEFINKTKIKVAHILFKTEKDNSDTKKKYDLANDVLKQLQQGNTNFHDAAKMYSEDRANASKGGIIKNYFTKGTMDPNFEKEAFKLNSINTMSKVIRSQFGYHIIKLIDRVEESKIPYVKVKSKLIYDQKVKYSKMKLKKFVNSFNETKQTTLYVPAFERVITTLKKEVDEKLKK